MKVHGAEGDTVTVGAVLAEIQPDGAASENGASSNRAVAPPPAAEPRPPTAGEVIDIVTPAPAESVTEGTLLEWHVEVGATVADGDTVVEISTDKVDVELPARRPGEITSCWRPRRDGHRRQVIARMRVGRRQAPAAPARRATGRRVARSPPSPPRRPRASRSPRRRPRRRRRGCRPRRGHRLGPRRPRHEADVLAAGEAPASNAPSGRADPRRRRDARAYMDEPVDPDGHLVPHAHRHADGRAAQAAQEAGQKVSFTHLIAWAIAKPRRTTCP